MGCPSSCEIGDNLVFSICTHDTDTGELTDAASVPTYRIYNEAGTEILTGTMAKLDDDDTTGFYIKLIAVTAANGFESGKSYTVYIEATVDGVKGGITFAFKATNFWVDVITESYAADEAEASPAQLMYMIYSLLANHGIIDTAWTTKKLDKSTTAMSLEITLDVNGKPISVERLA